jgi:hypothetical protein
MFVDLGGTPSALQFLSPPATGAHTVHQNLPLLKEEKIYANRLVLRVEGNNFRDEAIVHFQEGASNYYSLGEDLDKWTSMLDNSTEIWMVADGHDLSINSPELLKNNPYEVPLSFKCGVTGTYSLSASAIESFNGTALIWLEDLKTGAPWQNLADNPVYEFEASPEDEYNRFILHFLGTAGGEEPDAEASFTIYTSREYAYIINNGDEEAIEYIVCDLMGKEVTRARMNSADLQRIYLGSNTACYIISVITDKNVYSQKVIIIE